MITTVQSRRGFLVGAAFLVIAAPAIVRAGSIMPVKAVRLIDDLIIKLDISRIESIFDFDLAIREMMEIQRVPARWLRST